MKRIASLALVGGFAHDRGCEQVAALIDCKVVESLEAGALLARAGWAAARAPAREKMAMSYLTEFRFAANGSLASRVVRTERSR